MPVKKNDLPLDISGRKLIDPAFILTHEQKISKNTKSIIKFFKKKGCEVKFSYMGHPGNWVMSIESPIFLVAWPESIELSRWVFVRLDEER